MDYSAQSPSLPPISGAPETEEVVRRVARPFLSTFPSSLDFTRAAVPFLRALPLFLRDVPGEPGLKHYGTGESGHWAVQINQQVAGTLACLAANPATLAEAGSPMSADEMVDLALAMTRYSLRTHKTGDLLCSDGQQWGRHWISVLGFERMIPGLDLLRRHFTAEDHDRLRALVAAECDYRMGEYEIVAAIDNSTGRNKPESNIWNGAFLLRAAADESLAGTDLSAPSFRERGTAFLLNGLSYPEDAADDTPVLGKPVREWHVGPNFTSEGALDHHGYLNVGYAYVCLSNLALLYFSFRERGLPPPDGFLHNLRRTWEWCKRCTFPDGRLLRIGGDTRSRYTYCQAFALQGWQLAWALWGDEDAAAFARGYLGLVAKEQAENPNGTFYGRRLAAIRAESPWFETRLECDPFTVLGTSAHWAQWCFNAETQRRRDTPNVRASGEKDSAILSETQLCDSPRLCASALKANLWSGAFHGAALLRTPAAVRSVVARAFAGPTRENAAPFQATGPAALCVPPGRSDLAEWSGNLFAFLGLRGPKHEGKATMEELPQGFRWRWEGDVIESRPLGEGESSYPVLHRVCTAEALPDGRTLRLSDRVECIKETTFPAGYRALNLQIPNDVYNGHRRRYVGEGGFSYESCSYPATPELIGTDSSSLVIDGVLAVRSLSGKRLFLRRPARQGALLYTAMTSLYIEQICTECSDASFHLMPGEVPVDEQYEVEVFP